MSCHAEAGAVFVTFVADIYIDLLGFNAALDTWTAASAAADILPMPGSAAKQSSKFKFN